MPSFTCPFCGCTSTLSIANYRSNEMSFGSLNKQGLISSSPYLRINIFRCPNDDCKKETVIAVGENGYMEGMTVPVYPQVIFKHFPNYIPDAIRKDYEDACLIQSRSPKAAATLARRCLQGMIHDFWNIHEKNLNAEITNLKDHIPAAQWKAIDALRQMGNIGAHMEANASLIVDISPDEAGKLIRLIELLLDKWYVNRHEEEALYADIMSSNKELQEQRHRPPDDP